jgi:hypothetical protein
MRRAGQRRGGENTAGQQRPFVVAVHGFPVADLAAQVSDRDEALLAASVEERLVVPGQCFARLLVQPVQTFSTLAVLTRVRWGG